MTKTRVTRIFISVEQDEVFVPKDRMPQGTIISFFSKTANVNKDAKLEGKRHFNSPANAAKAAEGPVMEISVLDIGPSAKSEEEKAQSRCFPCCKW